MMKVVVEASAKAADASERAANESKAAVQASAEISEKIADVSKETNKQAEDQGAKLTIFTVITTIFTPMNFLTSVCLTSTLCYSPFLWRA